MVNPRRGAATAGLAYLLSFASIPTLWLYAGVRAGAGAPGAASDALLGSFLEVLVALACVGTAVALYPYVRRQNEALALGFVGARTVEAALILVGVADITTLLRLRGAPGGAEPGAISLLGEQLVAHYDAVFLLSQSLMPGLNALLLGTLLLRSGLVPRALPLIGLVGAPLHLIAVGLTLFGVVDRFSPLVGLAALPIAAWEFGLGVYLVGWGFRPARTPVSGDRSHAERAG